MSALPLRGAAQGRPTEPRGSGRSQAVLLIACGAPAAGAMPSCPPEPCRGCALAAQAAALQRALPKGWLVLHAVQNGHPSIAEALASLRQAGVSRLVVIPLRPQFSATATAPALAELYQALSSPEHADLHVEVHPWWHDDSAYVEAHARLIHDFASERRLSPLNSVLVFTGDADETADRERLQTAATLLRERLGWPAERATLVPSPDPGGERVRVALEALGAEEAASLLLCPLTRMAACPLLSLVLLPGADSAPVHVCPAPGLAEPFIKALALLVRRGRQPAQRPEPPLMAPADTRAIVAARVDDLLMVGVCVECTLGRIGGPILRYCPHEALRGYKRPHLETIALLRSLGSGGLVRECWVWNTCSRYEVYAWVHPGTSDAQRREIAQHLGAEALGPGAAAHLNVLHGRDAWHHALRTAAGLNSVLVGDAEVADQLRAARCAAGYAGTGAELTGGLIQDVIASVADLRAGTAWGAYAHGYCDVALSRLTDRLGRVLAGGRCLVIGGSTTSCSILETLQDRFGVPRSRISLIYRGFRKGTVARRLREAVGEERTTIVPGYADPAVLAAVAEADAVFFAIDQRKSVLAADALARSRDLAARPLTVVDFNTFGSVVPAPAPGLTLIDAHEIDREVSAFNAEVLRHERLGAALGEAERWIDEHVHGRPERQAGRGPGGAGRRNSQEVAA